MSCSNCHCSPCTCSLPAGCCPEVEVVEYSYENQNLAGVGTFDNELDRLVGFRGIVSVDDAILVNLNAGNKTIEIGFDIDLLVNDLPDATTAQRGVLETATDAEAIAKIATDKIVTPSNFAAMGSTQTFAGFIEIATQAEVTTGTDDTRAITPLKLAVNQATQKTTATTADAVSRAALAPTFIGQFLLQLDTDEFWYSTGLAAGNWASTWNLPGILNVVGNTNLGAVLNVTGAANIGGLVLMSNGLGVSGTATLDLVNILGTTFTATTTNINFTCTNFNIANAAIDLQTCTLELNSVIVPGTSVIVTGAAGTLGSQLLNTFISTAFIQSGWGTPSGTLARTTFAAYNGQVISAGYVQAEIVAMDAALVIVSQRLAALVTDLKARLLPAA